MLKVARKDSKWTLKSHARAVVDDLLNPDTRDYSVTKNPGFDESDPEIVRRRKVSAHLRFLGRR